MSVICIVGSSKIDETKIRPLVGQILDRCDPLRDLVISGGARGVDTVVENMCDERGIRFRPFYPVSKAQYYYLERNRKMAEAAERIYVIAIKGTGCYHHGELQSITHDRTGGCYTARSANPSVQKELFIYDPESETWSNAGNTWRGIMDEPIAQFQTRLDSFRVQVYRNRIANENMGGTHGPNGPNWFSVGTDSVLPRNSQTFYTRFINGQMRHYSDSEFRNEITRDMTHMTPNDFINDFGIPHTTVIDEAPFMGNYDEQSEEELPMGHTNDE